MKLYPKTYELLAKAKKFKRECFPENFVNAFLRISLCKYFQENCAIEAIFSSFPGFWLFTLLKIVSTSDIFQYVFPDFYLISKVYLKSISHGCYYSGGFLFKPETDTNFLSKTLPTCRCVPGLISCWYTSYQRTMTYSKVAFKIESYVR